MQLPIRAEFEADVIDGKPHLVVKHDNEDEINATDWGKQEVTFCVLDNPIIKHSGLEFIGTLKTPPYADSNLYRIA